MGIDMIIPGWIGKMRAHQFKLVVPIMEVLVSFR